MPLYLYKTLVSTSAQLSFPVHVSAFARTIEVKQTRCGGGRLPLPGGIKPEAPHLASAFQGLGKAASGKDTRDFTAGAGARGVDTRRAALTPGGDPGPGPRQGPALRGGSQGKGYRGREQSAPVGEGGLADGGWGGRALSGVPSTKLFVGQAAD